MLPCLVARVRTITSPKTETTSKIMPYPRAFQETSALHTSVHLIIEVFTLYSEDSKGLARLVRVSLGWS